MGAGTAISESHLLVPSLEAVLVVPYDPDNFRTTRINLRTVGVRHRQLNAMSCACTCVLFVQRSLGAIISHFSKLQAYLVQEVSARQGKKKNYERRPDLRCGAFIWSRTAASTLPNNVPWSVLPLLFSGVPRCREAFLQKLRVGLVSFTRTPYM